MTIFYPWSNFFFFSEIGPLSDVADLTVPDSTQDPLPTSRPVADEVMVSHGAHSAIATKSTVTQTEGGVVKPMDVMAEAESCSPALQSSAVIDLTGQSLPFTIGKKQKHVLYGTELFFLVNVSLSSALVPYSKEKSLFFYSRLGRRLKLNFF